jgi:hypothetical protein
MFATALHREPTAQEIVVPPIEVRRMPGIPRGTTRKLLLTLIEFPHRS